MAQPKSPQGWCRTVPSSPVPRQAHTCPGWEWRSALLPPAALELKSGGLGHSKVKVLLTRAGHGPSDIFGSTAWQGMAMTDQGRPGSAPLLEHPGEK